MLASFVLTLFLLQVAPPPTVNNAAPVRAGDRVQVFGPALTPALYAPVTGRVRRVGATDLVVTTASGADRQIPLAAIVDLRRDSTPGQEKPHWEELSLKTVRPQPLPGTFVRIVSPRLSTRKPVRGTIRSWRADSVTFVAEGDSSLVALGVDEVNSVEWPVRVRRGTRTGARIGSLVGLVAGVVVGASVGKPCTPTTGPDPLGLRGLDDICHIGKILQVMAAAGGGALAGAGLGAVIGQSIRWTDWERGEPSGRRISFAPLISRRGAGITMSVGF